MYIQVLLYWCFVCFFLEASSDHDRVAKYEIAATERPADTSQAKGMYLLLCKFFFLVPVNFVRFS